VAELMYSRNRVASIQEIAERNHCAKGAQPKDLLSSR
jgi:hypothetical protein